MDQVTVKVPGKVVAGVVVKDRRIEVGQAYSVSTPDGPCQPDGAAGPSPEEIQRIVDQARQQASAELQQTRDELVSTLAAVRQAVEEAQELREQILHEAEEQLVDLAVEISRKVLMQEIRAGRYEIEPIVTEALKRVPPRRSVVVHLHPDDWAQCDMVPDEDGEDSGGGRLRFAADPGVRRGECVLETPEGTIDSSIETHLDDIRDALKGLE
ncbi:MAG: FliH/SctL family protein [Phycisphaerae bacterium]